MTYLATQELVGRMIASEFLQSRILSSKKGESRLKELQPNLDEPDIDAIIAAIAHAKGDLQAFSASVAEYLKQQYPDQATP